MMKTAAELIIDILLAAAYAFVAFGLMVLLFCVSLKVLVEIFQ